MNPGASILTSPPNLFLSYLRALRFDRASLAGNGVLPGESLQLDGVSIEPDRLDAYRRSCGFMQDCVPITYPMIMSIPLLVAYLSRPEWPIKPAGLVHLGIMATQHRPVTLADRYTIRCSSAGTDPHPRGRQFETHLELFNDAGIVWTCVNLILSREADRRGTGGRHRVETGTQDIRAWQSVGSVQAMPGTGRRYAWCSGDWNPIHLGVLPARLFGFRRAVAHGMWTLGAALAVIDRHEAGSMHELEARFRSPLYLPGHAEVLEDREGRFMVRECSSEKTVLEGRYFTP